MTRVKIAGMVALLIGCQGLFAETQTEKPVSTSDASHVAGLDYERAKWHPSHFLPHSATATDEQCLACHAEILERKPKAASPAGLKTEDTLAWYQTVSTYRGEQDTFHRRHLVTDVAKRWMNLRCNTCHLGIDPREEAPPPPASGASVHQTGFTLRKSIDPSTTCLKCHGTFPYKTMGLPGSWREFGKQMGGDCLICHATIRTTRHEVNYLHPKAIEEDARKDPETCFGCHGGRAWYRIAYPYARNPWPGMAKDVPEWAKDRPTQSESRFRHKP